MNDFLHIFDFDYTLYETFELIKVWSPRGDCVSNGKNCFKINPSEYHHLNLGADEYLDKDSYIEFSKINWNKAIPIAPTLCLFKLVKNKIILTARPESVKNSIAKKIKGNYKIHCLDNGDPNAKINFIKKMNCKNIIIYEDSQLVIDLCNKNSISNVKVSKNRNKINLNYSLY